MLIISGIVSSLLLILVWVSRRILQQPGGVIVLLSVVAVGGPLLVGMFLTPVVIQAALLVLSLSAFWSERSSVHYMKFAIAGTAVAWMIATSIGLLRLHEISELRERYPDESLDDRLPPRLITAPIEDEPVDPDERQINEMALFSKSRNRTVEKLHEQQLKHFVHSEGFGVARMLARPSEDNLRSHRDESPIPQPGPILLSPYSERPDPPNSRFHDEIVVDFVNPLGFGVVKDRRLLGFLPHGMTKVPEAGNWRVINVDLVGVVVHEKPVAYISTNLPRMDELRKAPTRPLDAFEMDGLANLQAGQHLHKQETDGRMRMLGAIRSTKQCIQCHGGARGDLLGAFSYTLLPAR